MINANTPGVIDPLYKGKAVFATAASIFFSKKNLPGKPAIEIIGIMSGNVKADAVYRSIGLVSGREVEDQDILHRRETSLGSRGSHSD
ncbi:hypothetical protein CSPX01_09689 [Colletotrichum filicis]|nr:hypothetical protein CSPX01_09689 [Colletotrichum filicis]